MAVASLVLGILAMVVGVALTFVSSLSIGFTVGIPLAVLALGLGIFARRKALAQSGPTGLPNAGIVLGVIGVILGACAVALFVYAVGQAKSAAGDDDPAMAERLKKERIKNSAEFDDVFKKAIEADQTAPAQKPGAEKHKTPAVPAAH